MKDLKKLNDRIKSNSTPIVTTKEKNYYGLHRGILKKLISAGEISKYSKGIYIKNNSWEDEFQLLQLKYPKGIYSHNTALYLLGYSDRTPALFTMTFPHGYNASSLVNEPIEKKQSIKEIYNLGYKTAKRIIKKEYKINK